MMNEEEGWRRDSGSGVEGTIVKIYYLYVYRMGDDGALMATTPEEVKSDCG